MTTKTPRTQSGFSLIEVLAAVAIIGIITFLALPNIITLKQDAEVDLAIARAEAVNMAIAAYVQANGQATADSTWSGASAADRWTYVSPFLAFAPTSLAEFMPADYALTFPGSVNPLTKSRLDDAHGTKIDY